MSKTVTIPTTANPWKCMINGVSYVYPAGTEQLVPDAVAELIAELEEREKITPSVDKPFADAVLESAKATGGIGYTDGGNISWDGVLEHAVDYVDLEGGAHLVRISEEPIPIEEFSSATLIIHNPDGEVFQRTHKVIPEYITEIDGAYGYMDFISVIPEDGEYGKRGVHTAWLNEMYCEEIILGDGSIHKIDPKYIHIPAAPAEDGVYHLIVAVADGEPDYVWEEV